MTAFQALITTGTPDAGWLAPAGEWLRALCPHDLALSSFSHWVQAQQGAMPADVPGFGRAGQPVWGGLDPAAAELLPALGHRFPRMHAVFWLQAPAELLADRLLHDPATDVTAVLAAWRRAAEAMLAHLQRHHERSLMLDVAEWRAVPQAAGARLAAFLGLPEAPPWPVPPAAPEPLPMALAQALLAGRPDVFRLHQQCLAACTPLVDDPAAALQTSLDDEALRRAAEQWHRTRQAVTAAQDAAREAARAMQAQHDAELAQAHQALTVAEDAAREAVQAMQAQHDAELAQARQAVTAAQDAAREAAQAMQAQHDAELAQARQALTQAQAAARVEAQSAKQALAQQTERAMQLQAAHAALEALARERAGELDTTLTAWLALQEEHLRVQAAAAQAAARAQDEQRALLRQLHEQQDQLDRLTRDRAAQVATRSPLRADPLQWGTLERAAVRDEPPHCELGFVLTDVRAQDRHLARVDCRLVEHHAHAGLVLLRPGAEAPPLLAWSPSGQEGGRELVLLIPDDDDGRRRLDAMGGGDRLFIEALVAALEAALAQDRLLGPRWRPVVQRLRETLWRQPLRWRYDRFDAQPVDGGHRLRFQGVLCGPYRAAAVDLIWRPAKGTVALLWPADPADAPLVSRWPRGDDGRALPAWTLPIGDGGSAAEQRRRWHVLPRADRELLLCLLEALAGQATGQPAPAGVDAAAWRTLPGLLKAGLQLQHGGRWRRLAQALRGRLPARG